MIEKIKEIEINNSTFHNFNIANNKTNISVKVNEMNENVSKDIQLIKKLLAPLKFRNNKYKNDNYYNKEKRNLEYPLIEKKAPKLLKLNINSTYKKKNPLLNKNYHRKVFLSLKKNLNDNNNTTRKYEKDNPYKIIDKTINNTKTILVENNDNISNANRNNKSSFKFEKYNNNKKINSFNSRNKNFPIKNLKNASYNYYITSNQFNTHQKSLNNITDSNSYRNNTNNNNILILDDSFNTKKEHNQLISDTYKDFRNSNNSSEKFNEKTEQLTKIDLNCSELERKVNKSYKHKYREINKKNKDIKKLKEKCKILLKELDKKNNFEIQQIISEINDQLLSLGFNDFFRYLLTLLKNYDKKIVSWSYDIVEDKNACPEELKYKNVRQRHQQFMGMLNKQYIYGLNINNHVENLISNSRDKLGYNNITSYGKYKCNIPNNSSSQDKYKTKLYTEKNNNKKTNFFDTFLKIKNNNI